VSETSDRKDDKLKRALRRLAEERGVALAGAVTPIFWANFERCYVHRFVGDGFEEERLWEYLIRLADNYEAWHEYVDQAQNEKNPLVWEDLYIKLQKWASVFLRNKVPFVRNDILQEHVAACVSVSVHLLLKLRFHYESEFDSWACPVVHNACRKHLHKVYQQLKEECNQLTELDNVLHAYPEPSSLSQFIHTEQRLDLEPALAQLTEKRRLFVQLYYFEERGFTEIAVKMETTVSALYKLHHDALNELSKILGGNRDK
jgi:RNA polymerase sigma factor (sigma-70 family)